MLTVSNLTKSYGKVCACRDVSFVLEPGTITVLLGPNGAGKSTLIKSVIGFLKYTGKVTVDRFDNKSVEAKRRIGYIPEIPALYPNLTVNEHLEFIARIYGLTDYRAYADELLDRFELSDKKKKFGDELSKGMRQKVNIICGVLPAPDVILLDEPMIGLDPHAIKELKLLLGELRSAGKSVLVSTHMIDSVDMLWDNALIMKDGCVLADINHNDIKDNGKTLEDIFFGLTEGIDYSKPLNDTKPEE